MANQFTTTSHSSTDALVHGRVEPSAKPPPDQTSHAANRTRLPGEIDVAKVTSIPNVLLTPALME